MDLNNLIMQKREKKLDMVGRYGASNVHISESVVSGQADNQ